MNPENLTRRWALLLSGGAFKGAVQLPVIEALLQTQGHLPDEVRGTSVGALNGVMLASDRVSDLRDIWEDVDDGAAWNGVRGFLQVTPFSKSGFWSLDPLRNLLVERRVSAIQLKTRFACGIWLPERDQHIVPTWSKDGAEKHSVTLHDGVLASSAIAGLFTGVDITWEGTRSCAADGGHEHVLPPAPSWLKAGDQVDAVFCHPIEPGIITKRTKDLNGRIERLCWAADKATHAPTRGDAATLKVLAETGVQVRIWAPRRDPGDMLDASRATIKKRLALGKEMAAIPVWTSPSELFV